MMPAIYEHFHVVRPDEIDVLGHVSNLAYLRWAVEAALAHTAAQGWPAETYREQGLGWVVRSHEIHYLRPAVEGDEIVVRTWVAGMRRATSLRRYEIVRAAANEQLARAATNWAFIDFATGKPKRIPPEIVASFELVPDEPEE